MKVEFARESAMAADNPGVTSQRLVNCYPAPVSVGARSPFVLRSALGYSNVPKASLNNQTARAAIGGPDFLYVAASGRVHSIARDFSTKVIGGVVDDVNTVFARTREGVSLSAGDNYYLWDGGNFTQPQNGAFTGASSVAFLDQYTVLSEPGGRGVEWTELGDPSDRNALHIKTKEGRADQVVRVMASSGRLIILGQESTEVWYNTGAAGALAFERVQGAVIDIGLKAVRLCVEYENSVFFVGDDNTFYRMSGGQPAPLSTGAVSKAINDETPANVFAYEDRGHKFICVRFDSRPAWCYDLTTGAWHERSTGANFGPWEVVDAVKAYGAWVAVTIDGGIYEFERVNKDGDTPMRRTMVSLPLDLDGAIFSVSALEFRIQGGMDDIRTGPILGVGSRPASASLRVSRDGGATFGPEKKTTFGEIGQYALRARFRGLGAARNFTAELSVSDPGELPVESSALVEVA